VVAFGGERLIVETLTRIPLAHTGHLLVDLSVFLGPLLIVAIWLTIAARRDRRSGRNSMGVKEERRTERADPLR
jgi:hypothetical protein